MTRFALAFRSFFALISSGKLPPAVLEELRLEPKKDAPAKPQRVATPADGALQLLGVLQRDARLVDFLMEDISNYSDDQVGAAVRSLHSQCAEAIQRHVKLSPVIDGVEGTFTKIDPAAANTVKLVGNVPASGKAPGGTLRHRGWRADSVNLPNLLPSQNTTIVAPAEVEIE